MSRSSARSDRGRRDRRASPPSSALATGARPNEASWVHANDVAGKSICKNFNRGVCKAKERKGTEGFKFADFIDQRLEPPPCPLRETGLAFTFPVGNVIMTNEDREHFDDTLRCHSFVCKASDLGPVRRPRLWWTNAEQELREGKVLLLAKQ